ncbi:MAG TPA: ankyrin repeat domain-containing protein [Ktedonobacterales bacterium]|nr:ankyrin repeat domain-containing protein [Ktedonobacterales bacterium]
MPVTPLPPNPNLDHLKYQARDLLKAHASRELQAAQRIREFHPRFQECTDAAIFDAHFRLSDAQLTIARERGFASWARLKRRIEQPTLADKLDLPHHERIENPAFRQAVDLLDRGDVDGLRAHLNKYPRLVRERVTFEGGNYFDHPTLLEFVAENPVRRGTLPDNIVEVAKVILDAGAKEDQSALNDALGLVSTGCVPRECRVHLPLIDLLCDYGAEPTGAALAALAHWEFEAVDALLRNGVRLDLVIAAGLGRIEDFQQLLPASTDEERHRALALASQHGHAEIVRLLLDAGEDPNRYNPVEFHAHSTPLHQAAAWGHDEVVRLLVEHGARPDMKDTTPEQGTPADWARHEGQKDIEEYLQTQEALGRRRFNPIDSSPEAAQG